MPAPKPARPPRHEIVYLASQSPRRQQMLDQLGVVHRPLLPGPDEDAESLEVERRGEAPLDYVQRVTAAKLGAARHRLKRLGVSAAPILCADTTVVLGRRILGKPLDDAQACQMLSALSGRMHRVMTAVAVYDGRRTHSAVQVSRVHFSALLPALIRRYVAGGEPRGKAGAYAIQGALAGHIQRIDGSHSGIMGLPLFEAAQLLRAAGVRLPI